MSVEGFFANPLNFPKARCAGIYLATRSYSPWEIKERFYGSICSLRSAMQAELERNPEHGGCAWKTEATSRQFIGTY